MRPTQNRSFHSGSIMAGDVARVSLVVAPDTLSEKANRLRGFVASCILDQSIVDSGKKKRRKGERELLCRFDVLLHFTVAMVTLFIQRSPVLVKTHRET